MKSSVYLFAVGIVVGVCVCVLLPGRVPLGNSKTSARQSVSDQSDRQEQERPSTDGLEDLDDKLAALAAEVAALRQQLPVRELAAPTAKALPTPPMRRDPQTLARLAQERHERMADVEVEFRAQSRDPKWARVSEASIQEAISNNSAMRGTAKNVECLAQTCRVEMAVESPLALSQELPNFLVTLPDRFSGSTLEFLDNHDGSKTAILYLARNEGTESNMRAHVP